MKKIITLNALLIVLALSTAFINKEPEPWTQEQLMQPEQLAMLINDENKTNDPVIFNIGPSGAIKGSIEIGFVNDNKGLKKLQTKLGNLAKDQTIVLYCGCCPFEHCPNIRPAFTLLNKQGFKNHYLLDLPENLKVDWIDKGFPMEE